VLLVGHELVVVGLLQVHLHVFQGLALRGR
jgi:hypothetical protein